MPRDSESQNDVTVAVEVAFYLSKGSYPSDSSWKRAHLIRKKFSRMFYHTNSPSERLLTPLLINLILVAEQSPNS